VCASFTADFKPYECLEEFDIQREVGHAKKDFVKPRHYVKRAIVLSMLVCVVVFNLCLVWMCKRCLKRKRDSQVEQQVRHHVGEYFKMA
jgi:hypothetical protein